MLIVEPDIAFDGAAQVFAGLETIRRQHVGDPAVEAFDHAVGLRVSRLGQAMFDTQCDTEPIKRMFAAGLLLLVEQAIGEFTTVVPAE